MKKQSEGYFDNKTDVKIFILFLMDSINAPLDYTTLNNIVTESGYIGRFDFAECFSELCDLGHILEESNGNEKYYVISESGKTVAYELQGNILESIREKSSKTAARIMSLYNRGLQLKTEISEQDDKKILLSANMTDDSGKVFCFDLRVPSKSIADKVKKNFEDKPNEIYRAFMSMITGDIDYFIK